MDENASSSILGMLQPGTIVLGRYKIEAQLASGGQGAVYGSLDTNMERSVAIKVISCDAGSKKEQRFQQEARILAALDHPNIVRVYAFGKIDESKSCLVMEYIEGESLAKMIASSGALSPDFTCGLFAQLLDALAYLHSNKILHRDLKPGNILICRSGVQVHAKLVDFGIAKILEDETQPAGQTRTLMVGTPNYMSPEQCRGESLDERSDLYSLACVLYEALTAKPPFDGEAPFAVLSKQATDEFIIPQNIPKSLANIIRKASSKKTSDRFSSASEMRTAILEGRTKLEPEPQNKRSGGKILSKNSALASLALVLFLAALFAISSFVKNQNSSGAVEESVDILDRQLDNMHEREASAAAREIISKDRRTGSLRRIHALSRLVAIYKLNREWTTALEFDEQLLHEAGTHYKDVSLVLNARYVRAGLLSELKRTKEAIAEAERTLENALRFYPAKLRRSFLSPIYVDLANWYCDQKNYALALERAQSACSVSRGLGDERKQEANALNVLVRALLLLKNYPEAMKKAKELMAVSVVDETKKIVADRLEMFAVQCTAQENYDQARAYFKLANSCLMPEDNKTRYDLMEASGSLELKERHPEKAREIWLQIMNSLDKLDDKNSAHMAFVLGQDFYGIGDQKLSSELLDRAYHNMSARRLEKTEAAILLSRCYFDKREFMDAAEYAKHAKEMLLSTRPDDFSMLCSIEYQLAEIYRAAGETELAAKSQAEVQRLKKIIDELEAKRKLDEQKFGKTTASK